MFLTLIRESHYVKVEERLEEFWSISLFIHLNNFIEHLMEPHMSLGTLSIVVSQTDEDPCPRELTLYQEKIQNKHNK